MHSTNDKHTVLKLLRKVRREIRLAVGLRGSLIASAVLSSTAVVSLLADRLFRLGVPSRALLLLVFVGVVGYVVWHALVRPLREPLSERSLADMVERERPHLGDRLRSAVDFLADPVVTSQDVDVDFETALKRTVVSQAGAACRSLGDLSVVDYRAVGKSALGSSVGLLALTLLFFLLGPSTASLWFKRNILLSSEPWPYQTPLVVEGFESGRRGVAKGDPLTIAAIATKQIPSRAWIDIVYPSGERENNLERKANRFEYTHHEVREPFRFRVRGGDYRSPWFDVVVLERPRLSELTITQVYPSYLESIGWTPREVDGGQIGEISPPAGTRLKIRAVATKPIQEATIQFGGATLPLAVTSDDSRQLSGDFLPEQSDLLRLFFTDTEGVTPTSEGIPQLQVRLIADRPPTVKLRSHGVGSMVSARARIPVRGNANDDYRVEHIILGHSVSELLLLSGADSTETTASKPGPGETTGDVAEDTATAAPPATEGELEGKRDLEFEADKTVRFEAAVEVAEIGIEPERRLTITVSATDNDTLNGPNEGTSNTLEFLVVSDQKLMDDLLRRQEDQREAFQRILQREETIRDALYSAIYEQFKTEGALDTKTTNALTGHSREERTLVGHVESIAKAVEGILTELKNNRVGEADDIERIGDKVVEPLRQIARDEMPAIASKFDALSREEDTKARVSNGLALAEDVEKLIEHMEDIIANMVKLETFSEIVNLLRDVIKIEDESLAELRRAYKKLLDEDVFEN